MQWGSATSRCAAAAAATAPAPAPAPAPTDTHTWTPVVAGKRRGARARGAEGEAHHAHGGRENDADGRQGRRRHLGKARRGSEHALDLAGKVAEQGGRPREHVQDHRLQGDGVPGEGRCGSACRRASRSRPRTGRRADCRRADGRRRAYCRSGSSPQQKARAHGGDGAHRATVGSAAARSRAPRRTCARARARGARTARRADVLF